LARPDPILRAADVLTPNVRLGRGLPERHGEGGADAWPEASGDDGGQLFVLHAADVRETPRGAIRGADSRVRQDVVAEAGVGFDPLGVEQRTRCDAEGRVEGVVEEPTARPRRESPDAGKGRGVAVVPLVRPVEPPGCLPNHSITPILRRGARKRLVYQILTRHSSCATLEEKSRADSAGRLSGTPASPHGRSGRARA